MEDKEEKVKLNLATIWKQKQFQFFIHGFSDKGFYF